MSKTAGYLSATDPDARIITAEPEALTFRPDQSALVVVDMQNAYASPGGYLDLAGFDITGARRRHREGGRGGQDRPGRRDAHRVLPERVGPGIPGGWRPGFAQLPQIQRDEDDAQPAGVAGPAFGEGVAGTTRWSMRCSPSRAISCSPSHATAPSTTPRWTACCAHAASARWSSPASPRMSASSRRCGTGSSWNISAWSCTTRRMRQGRPSCRKQPCTTSRPSSAGVSSVEAFRGALQANATPGLQMEGH